MPPQEESSGPQTTPACPSEEESHLSPSCLCVYRNPPSLGKQPSCEPWQPSSDSHLAVAIKMMLPFHFHRMQSFRNRRGSKSEFKLLFTRNQYFHKIIRLGEGMDYTDPRWQNVALWGLWDGCSWARKPKCRPTPTHFSKFTSQVVISQISTQSLPCGQGPARDPV